MAGLRPILFIRQMPTWADEGYLISKHASSASPSSFAISSPFHQTLSTSQDHHTPRRARLLRTVAGSNAQRLGTSRKDRVSSPAAASSPREFSSDEARATATFTGVALPDWREGRHVKVVHHLGGGAGDPGQSRRVIRPRPLTDPLPPRARAELRLIATNNRHAHAGLDRWRRARRAF